jgi:hypothetical protein
MRPMTTAEARQMFAAQQAMYTELIQKAYQAGLQSSSNLSISVSGNPQTTTFPPPHACHSSFQPSLPISPPLGPPAAAVQPIVLPSPLNPVSPPVLNSVSQLQPTTSTSTTCRRQPPSYVAALSLSTPPVTNYSATPITPRPLPCSNRIIPKVPRGADGWRTVISDWEEGDESRSLPVPLKDWPQEWYSRESGRTLGTLYNNRRLIATEFIKQ